MYWNREKEDVSLSPEDVKIMGQCRIPMEKFMIRNENPQLPPLWSILSYAMLQHHREQTNAIWRAYRIYKELFKKADSYYYKKPVPKANGGYRELHVPIGKLAYEQLYLFREILNYIPVDSHAYAYRKGISMRDCARPHIGKKLVIRMDIQNFFGSITENMVYEALLYATGYSKSLCRFFARICCYRKHLPQGAITSPVLSNIVFRPHDMFITLLAKDHGMEYTRYSDDLYFSGNTDNAEELISRIKAYLKYAGFRINEEKTKVRRPQHRQAVLGMTVNEKLQVSRKYKRNLLQEIYYLEKFGKNSRGAEKEGDYLRYVQRLMGKVTYCLSVCPEDEKLQKALKMLKKRIFLVEREFY